MLYVFKEKQQQQQLADEGNILDLQQRRDDERKKIREEKARLARRAAIQVAICWLVLLVLGIRRQEDRLVLALAAHILKLEGYRED